LEVKAPLNGPFIMHATCVDVEGAGILIVGRSGSGKSSLAVSLLALGASLVADDQCELIFQDNGFLVTKPLSLPDNIEIRGIGLVSVPILTDTSLCWIVNMDETEKERMPKPKFTEINGYKVPTIFGKNVDDLASRIYVLVKNIKS
tara:strand:- start:132 stop:569 length:438 start_codon:yes stop_codon:yes gene_type:complete